MDSSSCTAGSMSWPNAGADQASAHSDKDDNNTSRFISFPPLIILIDGGAICSASFDLSRRPAVAELWEREARFGRA